MTTATVKTLPPRWYYWYLAVVGTVALIALSVGITGMRADTKLLDCFDAYATRSAATSVAVRDASARVTVATTDRDEALQAVFDYIEAKKQDRAEGDRLFGKLLDANSALLSAQLNLSAVRASNPVPEPPSEFCQSLEQENAEPSPGV